MLGLALELDAIYASICLVLATGAAERERNIVLMTEVTDLACPPHIKWTAAGTVFPANPNVVEAMNVVPRAPASDLQVAVQH